MAGWTTAIARYFVKRAEVDEAETDADVRRALARLDSYPNYGARRERRTPVRPRSGNVISLWPR